MTSTELIATPGENGIPSSIELTRTSLKIIEELSIEEWLQVTQQFLIMDGALQWWLGDLLGYGESAFGEKYTQAADLTGRSPGTLANWAYVAKAFPPERRRETLGWWAHQELCKYTPDEQNEWLDAVERENWTRHQLRSELRHTPTGDSPERSSLQPSPESPTKPPTPPRVEPEPDRQITWEIQVCTPETANIIGVEEEVRSAAIALEMRLEELHSSPQVTVFLVPDYVLKTTDV